MSPNPQSEIPNPQSPKHWLFAASIPLPPLPDSFQDQATHDKLLSDYLDWTGNYVQLAQKHGLDFDTFDRWLHSDLIQTRIKRIDAMSDVRAKTLAKQHRAVAITRLVEIVEDTRSSPVRDRVRAASQILKAAEKADNRELREAKAAAHRALTKIATTTTDDDAPHVKLTGASEPLPLSASPLPTSSPACALRLIRHAEIAPAENQSGDLAVTVRSAIAREGDATGRSDLQRDEVGVVRRNRSPMSMGEELLESIASGCTAG